eukprot:274369_1
MSLSSLLRLWCFILMWLLSHNSLHIKANIITAQTNEYKNSQITCETNEDCTINCQTANSCENALVECPINNKCNITCSAPYSCQDLSINGTYSSLLIINDCTNGNKYTCSGLSIYFPANTNGKPNGIINVGNNFNSVSKQLKFYAINGWIDINTSLYNGNFQKGNEGQGINGSMFCSPHYNEQCILNPYKWECNDIDHICNNYTRRHLIQSTQQLIQQQSTKNIMNSYNNNNNNNHIEKEQSLLKIMGM